MTDTEWLACADPDGMLESLRGRASDRKQRLFAVACCRRIWHLLTDQRNRELVEAVERYADGEWPRSSLEAAWEAARGPGWVDAVRAAGSPIWDAAWGFAVRAAWDSAHEVACTAAIRAARSARDAVAWAAGRAHQEAARQTERQAHSALLRCLFGPGARLPTVSGNLLAWNGGTICKLARTVYEDRRWQDLPILADALEEAGCTDEIILGHCRKPGEHARGCWVMDLILNRT